MRFGAVPLLCAALALGLTLGAVGPTTAEASPPAHAGGKGKGGPPDHAGKDKGGPPDHAGGPSDTAEGLSDTIQDTIDETVNDTLDAVEEALFGELDEEAIREYFEPYRTGRESLPPGLAKRDELPPGLAKRDTLPPGLRGRGQALPDDLEARLPTLEERLRRLIFGDDVVIMDTTNDVVVDILRNVL
jgi:hypothetical protein